MLRPSAHWKLVACLTALVALFGAVRLVLAHGSDTSASAVHACVEDDDPANPNPMGYDVRLFTPTQGRGPNVRVCPDGWHELHWGIQGPKGETGPQGLKGEAGLPGAPGQVLFLPSLPNSMS